MKNAWIKSRLNPLWCGALFSQMMVVNFLIVRLNPLWCGALFSQVYLASYVPLKVLIPFGAGHCSHAVDILSRCPELQS